MSGILDRYKAANPSGHWFDEDTMRFFKTKLGDGGFEADDGAVYFPTSEENWSGERRWSVRRLRPDGRIDTIGEFHSLTKYRAEQLIKDLAHGRIEVD